MKCKKSLMGFAALLIIIFHFYIPLTALSIESGIRNACYIGVDLFFFLSAYSLGKKEKIDYFPFIKNRFLSIYVPFILFAAFATLYKGYSITKFLGIILLKDFVTKGGGSFLWFAPGIMLVYLITPFLISVKAKMKYYALPIFLIGWITLALVYQYLMNQTALLILINRLPIFFLGLYYDEFRKKDLGKFKLPVIFILLAVGIFLTARYGVFNKLSKPVKDFYYIAAIPLSISIVGLWDYISQRVSVRNIPFSFIGNYTLEIYCLQMIIGYDLETYFLKHITSKSGTFLIFTISLLALAYFIYFIKMSIVKIYKRRKVENHE